MEKVKKTQTVKQTTNSSTKQKKKMSKGGIVLLVGIIVILIPCLIFGGILLAAALETGKPVEGSRFTNDLDPAITDTNTSTLKANIEAISGVDSVEIVLKSAQYRVNVDTSDSLSDTQLSALVVEVYNAVNSELPVATYFTATDSMKMYDLAINVYNFIGDDNIYYLLTKNSNMSDYSIQKVSDPQNEELAAELRGETVDNESQTDEESDSTNSEQ